MSGIVITPLGKELVALLSLVCNVCAGRRSLFTFPLGDIDKPCYVIVSLRYSLFVKSQALNCWYGCI